MKPLHLLVTGALLALSLSAHAAIERTIDKTFSVNGPGNLSIQTSGGSVTVMPGADGVVKITARQRIRADTDQEADELLKEVDLRFDQTGNDVRASATHRTKVNLGRQKVQIDFVATVPASFSTALRTSGGSVTVGDLGGSAAIRTSGGTIKMGKLGGPVEAHTSGGSISLTAARGDVTLDTSGGSIHVGHVDGSADLETSGGSITIDSVDHRLRARTSGGSIKARIAGAMQEDCSLATSGGSIRVSVEKGAAFHLDAATSGGSVRTEGLTLVVTGGQSRSKVVADVNGGGGELKLRTSGGGITVEAR